MALCQAVGVERIRWHSDFKGSNKGCLCVSYLLFLRCAGFELLSLQHE